MNAIDVHPFLILISLNPYFVISHEHFIVISHERFIVISTERSEWRNLNQSHDSGNPDIDPVGEYAGGNTSEEVADEGLGKKFAETE